MSETDVAFLIGGRQKSFAEAFCQYWLRKTGFVHKSRGTDEKKEQKSNEK